MVLAGEAGGVPEVVMLKFFKYLQFAGRGIK
jgi:hypothetical protein